MTPNGLPLGNARSACITVGEFFEGHCLASSREPIVANADDELEPRWPLYRQVGRFGALEDAVDVATRFFCHLALLVSRSAI